MNNEYLLNELNRIHPIGNEDGCLLFNIGVYDPCMDTRNGISVNIALLKEQPDDLNDLLKDDIYPSDYKLNHRFPNKHYVTLSQTAGRRVSKVGYQFVESIDTLHQYTYAVICIGNDAAMNFNQYHVFIFPIHVLLTKERRGSAIDIRFKYDTGQYQNMSAMIYKPTPMLYRHGWTGICYTDVMEDNSKYEYHLVRLQKNMMQDSYHVFWSMADRIVFEGFDLDKMMVL